MGRPRLALRDGKLILEAEPTATVSCNELFRAISQADNANAAPRDAEYVIIALRFYEQFKIRLTHGAVGVEVISQAMKPPSCKLTSARTLYRLLRITPFPALLLDCQSERPEEWRIVVLDSSRKVHHQEALRKRSFKGRRKAAEILIYLLRQCASTGSPSFRFYPDELPIELMRSMNPRTLENIMGGIRTYFQRELKASDLGRVCEDEDGRRYYPVELRVPLYMIVS